MISRQQLNRILACIALTPALQRVLVVDIPPDEFRWTVWTLKEMLESVTDRPPRTVMLGVSHTEDDLWDDQGLPSIAQPSDGEHLAPSGLLLPVDGRSTLAVIPDLARLSLAATRACVALADASMAHLERFSRQSRWTPRICWLANCSRADLSQVRWHLRDRFAFELSLPEPTIPMDARVEALRLLFEQAEPPALDGQLQDQLKRAAQHWPEIGSEAPALYDQALALASGLSIRRTIGLARLAWALARLDHADRVTDAHMYEAAQLIGAASKPEPETSTPPRPDPTRNGSPPDKPPTPSPGSTRREYVRPDGRVDPGSAQSAWKPQHEAIAGMQTRAPQAPKRDIDNQPPDDSGTSLRVPFGRRRANSQGTGPVVGSERVTKLSNLALIPTLIAAAPWQPVYCRLGWTRPGHFLIKEWDYRGYRRIPTDHSLVLLIDYTCLDADQRMAALHEHLERARTERAAITLIKVGAPQPSSPFHAGLLEERSLLVPRVREAIREKRASQATPLAHGLDLALQVLRREQRYGRGAKKLARLVILSDGRGNVRLEDSRRPPIAITRPIGNEGVLDALERARELRKLDHVQITLLNPRPRYYPELPILLAIALGAELVNLSIESPE